MAPTPVSEIAATHAMHPNGSVGPRTAAPTAMASAHKLVVRSEIARLRQPVRAGHGGRREERGRVSVFVVSSVPATVQAAGQPRELEFL